jgi:hypothetical protein
MEGITMTTNRIRRLATTTSVLGGTVAMLLAGTTTAWSANATAGPAPTPHAAAVRPRAAVGAPAVIARTDDGFVTLDRTGGVIRRFTADANHISLGGDVVAYSTVVGSGMNVRDVVIGVDARTGRELYRIRDAYAPIVVDGGRRVAFLPDRLAFRDRQGNSVWMREVDGSIRRLVQFRSAAGLPGHDTGMNGEDGPLGMSLDRTGSKLIIAQGNDVDLFIYDIWSVDTVTGAVRRLTTGLKSRFPSISANGKSVAYFRETELCGGEGPGYRAGSLRTVSTDGTKPTVVVHGTCDLFYTDPFWVSPTELAAARLTRTSAGAYTVDLVRISVTTKRVTVLARGIAYLNASTDHRAVYQTFDRAGFTVVDTHSRHAVRVSTGFLPQVSGDRRS